MTLRSDSHVSLPYAGWYLRNVEWTIGGKKRGGRPSSNSLVPKMTCGRRLASRATRSPPLKRLARFSWLAIGTTAARNDSTRHLRQRANGAAHTGEGSSKGEGLRVCGAGAPGALPILLPRLGLVVLDGVAEDGGQIPIVVALVDDRSDQQIAHANERRHAFLELESGRAVLVDAGKVDPQRYLEVRRDWLRRPEGVTCTCKDGE